MKTFLAVLLTSILLVPLSRADQYGSDIEAALARGRQANAVRKYADAIKEFKDANKLAHGSCSQCYAGLASAYLNSGDEHNAEENANKAITTARDLSERVAAHMAKGYVLMSFASRDAKHLTAADKEFRHALSEDSANVEAKFGLGNVLLKQNKDAEGISELQALVREHPNSTWARRAEPLIANPRRAREWFAPKLEALSLQGQKVSLSDLQGKIVVLDFWATWCPPCRASLPEIKDLLKKYPREKLVVISVSADEDEKAWKNFVASKGMEWPQILDGDHGIRRSFNVSSFPTYLVIDGEGVVRQRIAGMNPQESIAARLKDTLKRMPELR